jgi:5-methylcytosine-specific restriction endonuclease McrA
MPIRPDLREHYGPDWDELSLELREAAGWRCQGSPRFPDCRAAQGEPHPDTGSKVVLTVAHLDQDPANRDRANLRVLCQRCHLAHDAPHHRRSAERTRRRRLGNGELFEEREA